MLENFSIRDINGKGIPVPGNNIDTDRIIPARFMKCVTFDSLGEYAFNDERFDEKGNLKNHSFDDKKYEKSSILIVNKNFGCGSSREHAPQALLRYGIRAIIGESFAEIFRGNCISLGLVLIDTEESIINKLMEFVSENNDKSLTINIEEESVSYADRCIQVSIPQTERISLLAGTWNTLAVLMKNKDKIKKTASQLPYMKWS